MTARLILTAPESGSGKTLFTAGLCVALRQKGFEVQMFKAGPDYIDPSYHQLASGRPCRNLDTWMLPADALCDSFQRNSRAADMALIEGVMGLFDGFGAGDNTGSTAELAQRLQAPLILILPVRGQARSSAATVLGFHTFSPDITLSGILLNQVGSDKHAQLCQQAIEGETGVPVLGYLPRREEFVLPERHLGLIPTSEAGAWQTVLEKVGAQVQETVDLDRLIRIAQDAPALDAPAQTPLKRSIARLEPVVRLAVADDEAFSFTYPENLELLAEAGAENIPFSPLHDAHLPQNIDGLILSGGFPEVYAAELSQNMAMRQAIQQAAADQLPIYAECGGLMYLTQAIIDQRGQRWPMVGVLPGDSAMTRRLSLGYRLIEGVSDGPLLKSGECVRGHEFHYSNWQLSGEAVAPAYWQLDPRGNCDQKVPAGVQQDSIWASYIHIHFLSRPGLATRFIAWCRAGGQNE